MSRSREAAVPVERRLNRPRWWIIVLFALSQIIAFCLILEVGAHLLDPLGVSFYPETARLFDRMIIEEPIGYRLPAGLEGRYHGTEVKVNELGMRDRPVAPQKESGEYRILMIGDSVMFSIGVKFEDSIPFQVELLANKNAPPDRRYRTLNMGVPSYNTEQELTQLEELGLSLQPDAAVLLLVDNDVERKMWVYEKRSSFVANLAQRSYGASLVYSILRPWVKLILNAPRTDEISAETAGHDEPHLNPRYDEIAKMLTTIHQKLKAVGAKFLVVHHDNVRDGLVKAVRVAGRRDGFEVRGLDMWTDPRWKNEEPSDYVNSRVDGHCNPDGCKIYAIRLYESMLAADLLD